LAQDDLADMYLKGDRVPQDYAEALRLYRLAADQGVNRAQKQLADMYLNGLGVSQDFVRAHMWLNIAAADGSRDAAINRDAVVKHMTPAQIAEAQSLALEWKPTK
jgi:hypothetical protein